MVINEIAKHKDKQLFSHCVDRKYWRPMAHIFKAVRDIVEAYEDVVVVYQYIKT